MNIVLPALFAGAVAVFVTLAIERWGGRVGGLLGTLPSTIVPASLGIWWQVESVQGFQAAMYITPAGMLLNAGFLYLWREVPVRLPARWSTVRRLSMVSLLTLSAWMGAAVVLVVGIGRMRSAAIDLAWFGWAVTASIFVAGALACLRPLDAPRGSRRAGPGVLLMRGGLAAIAIGFAIWLSRVVGPLAAGVASVFPAIFLTTMVSLWLAQGEAVPAGAVGPMMLGSSAVAGFSVLAATTFPVLGPAWGSLVAWFGAATLFTLPGWWWLQRRRRA